MSIAFSRLHHELSQIIKEPFKIFPVRFEGGSGYPSSKKEELILNYTDTEWKLYPLYLQLTTKNK